MYKVFHRICSWFSLVYTIWKVKYLHDLYENLFNDVFYCLDVLFYLSLWVWKQCAITAVIKLVFHQKPSKLKPHWIPWNLAFRPSTLFQWQPVRSQSLHVFIVSSQHPAEHILCGKALSLCWKERQQTNMSRIQLTKQPYTNFLAFQLFLQHGTALFTHSACSKQLTITNLYDNAMCMNSHNDDATLGASNDALVLYYLNDVLKAGIFQDVQLICRISRMILFCWYLISYIH